MNQLLSEIRKTYRKLSDQLGQLNDLAEQGARRIDDLEREIALSMPDSDAFKAFMQKPYLLRRIAADRHELVVPRFIGFRAGWPVRTDGEYLVFQVSRFIDLITPLPDWLRIDLGYTTPDIQAYIDGDKLIVQDGDPAEIWQRFGGQRHFSARRGNTLYLKPKSKFQIMRDLVRQGILPWQPQSIPTDLRREPRASFDLREHQHRDFKTFLNTGAVSVFATGGAGKTYFGMYAAAVLKGKKVVLAPRRSILQQWELRMQAQTPEAFRETEFRTYQSLKSRPLRGQYSLIIYDEIQHLPANMGVRAASAETVARIGLSATPWREDGNEDIIPALCGFPVGADWPSGEMAEATIWVVGKEADKLALVRTLVEPEIEGKTMIFVYRLATGQKIATALGVPFISGGTRNQLREMQEADTFVVSKVADAGVSIDARRVIEVDFLGGRMEAGQRALRTRHAERKGEVHFIMTTAEYKQHSRRLSALFALGFDVRMPG